MRYLSIFSGIEAATVAWEPLGWEPVAFAEIDPFACAVLAHRFPDVPNLGDVTKIDWGEYEGAADLVVGGSPCQSFSVAGDRTGLEGASGLMWEWCRCVREVRPRWVVWENVPGCLSSSPKGTYGEDFRCLLRELDDMRFSVAWRVLDSQFFGVAQRRRRVFLCGASQDAFGDAADVCAGLVLLEPGSMRRDRPKGAEARKAVAARAGGRTDGEGVDTACYVVKTRCGRSGYLDDMGRKVTGGKGALVGKEVSFTVATSQDQVLFVVGKTGHGEVDGQAVRRFTPLECERLQGFPDGWTDVPYRGKDHPADGPRYKAIGNSMTTNVMRWIGERIGHVDALMA